MAFNTKPNLSSDKFEQFSGDTLNLSGLTRIFGSIEYHGPTNVNLTGKSLVYHDYLITGSTSFFTRDLNATSNGLYAFKSNTTHKGSGQVILTNGSANISGISTNFLDATEPTGVNYWRAIYIKDSANNWYRIKLNTPSSNTSVTGSAFHSRSMIRSGALNTSGNIGLPSYGTVFTGVTGTYNYYLGFMNWSDGAFSIAMGNGAYADNYAIALGGSSVAVGGSSFASGFLSFAGGNYSVALGAQTRSTGIGSISLGYSAQAIGNYSISLGVNTIANGVGSVAIGWGYDPAGGASDKPLYSSGDVSFNLSKNDSAQTLGHGALANNSGIFAGINHNIPSTSLRSVIIGGNTIKALSNDSDTVYLPKVRIGQGIGGALTSGSTSNNILTRGVNGIIETRTILSVLSGITANNGLSKSGNNIVLGGSLTGNTHILNSTGGSYFYFDNANNRIGIGTTTPTAKLNIKGNGTTTGELLKLTNSTGETRLLINDNGLTSIIGSMLIGHTALSSPTTRLQVRGIGTGTGNLALFEDSAGNARLTIKDNGSTYFNSSFIGIESQNSISIKLSSQGSSLISKAGLYANGSSGNTEYFTIGINDTSVIGRTNGINGGATYYDTRNGVDPIRFSVYNTSDINYISSITAKGNWNIGVSNTDTARLNIFQNGLTSGWVSILKTTPGTHMSLTSGAEFISQDFVGNTWTWLDGTVPIQRFNYFKGYTLNKTTTSASFTNAYNVYIDDLTFGAGVTGNKWSLGTVGGIKVGNFIPGVGITASIATNGEVRTSGGFNLRGATNGDNIKDGLYYGTTNVPTIYKGNTETVRFSIIGGSGNGNIIDINGGGITPISGNGNVSLLNYSLNIAPTSGTSTIKAININPAINTGTGTWSSKLIIYNYEPVVTSLSGVTEHLAFRATSGSMLIGGTTLQNAGTRLDVIGIASGTVARFANSNNITLVDLLESGSFRLRAGTRFSLWNASNTNAGFIDFCANGIGANYVGDGISLTDANGAGRFYVGTSGIGVGSIATSTGVISSNVVNSTTNTNHLTLGFQGGPGVTNFNPSSGNGTWRSILLNPTYNTTGTYSGNIYGIDYNPTTTSLSGATHIAFRNTSGSMLIGHTTLSSTSTRLQVRGIGTTTGNTLLVENSTGSTKLAVKDNGNVVVGSNALSTGATTGFLHIPTCAGIPTGTPTTYTGTVPMVFDSVNNNFYIYNGGWKKVGLV